MNSMAWVDFSRKVRRVAQTKSNQCVPMENLYKHPHAFGSVPVFRSISHWVDLTCFKKYFEMSLERAVRAKVSKFKENRFNSQKNTWVGEFKWIFEEKCLFLLMTYMGGKIATGNWLKKNWNFLWEKVYNYFEKVIKMNGFWTKFAELEIIFGIIRLAWNVRCCK